ncbi:hypothetical protein ACFE04_006644 [Oxalis oulophora]
MDLVTTVVTEVKGIAKAGQDFIGGLLQPPKTPCRHNPIEILKRLQRESFSDIMKLRDRQDNVERFISSSKKQNSFQGDADTHLTGHVDAAGALMLLGNIDQRHFDAIDSAELMTGVQSRFTFKTNIRQKETLVAELVAANNGVGDVSGGSFSLAKVCYMADVNEWLSAIAIPIGAKCRDVDFSTDSYNEEKNLTARSSFGPPLLNLHNGSAIGLTVKKSNIFASLVNSVSDLHMQPSDDEVNGYSLNTFGQVVCQLPREIKLSLMGLHQMPKLSSTFARRGALTIPIGMQKHIEPNENTDASVEANTQDIFSSRSIALKLDKAIDESMRLGGWIEMKSRDGRNLKWGVKLCDDSDDVVGWGVSLSGQMEGENVGNQFQSEAYLKFNVGKRFSLKPGLVYVNDRNARALAYMLQSNWTI